jgi:hypothetical protein
MNPQLDWTREMIIKGVDVATGDGKTLIPNTALRIRDGVIVEIQQHLQPQPLETVVDRSGKLAIPGIINPHAHGCLTGPFSPHGNAPLPIDKISSERKKHLAAGETTVFNLCGFSLKEDMADRYNDPLRVVQSTSHTPHCIEAAVVQAGEGLERKHHLTHANQRIKEGVRLLGEIGAGGLLGGGTTDYKLVPEAIKMRTGATINPDQGRRLKWALLGRKLNDESYDEGNVIRCLTEMNIHGVAPDEIREIVRRIILPPLGIIRKGYEEAVRL